MNAYRLAILWLLAGCTANPFVNRTVESESGESVRYPFAYGQYCGPNRPTSANSDVPDELFEYWPPVDDIDAICLAHDYCLRTTNFSYKECDFAMAHTIRHFRQLFPQQACYNLATDMMSVLDNLTVGLWPTRKFQEALSVTNAAVTDPIVRAVTRKTDEYPGDGDCTMVTESSVTMVLDAFEYFFLVGTSPVGTDLTSASGNFQIPRDRVP